MIEHINEYVRNHGALSPERPWICDPFDTWHRNPSYAGPNVPHPEDSEPCDYCGEHTCQCHLVPCPHCDMSPCQCVDDDPFDQDDLAGLTQALRDQGHPEHLVVETIEKFLAPGTGFGHANNILESL